MIKLVKPKQRTTLETVGKVSTSDLQGFEVPGSFCHGPFEVGQPKHKKQQVPKS